jgi:hypothetical protein
VKVIIAYRWKSDTPVEDLEPVYGHGPWWLVLWYRVCGWFYGHYWDAQRGLER